MSTQNMIISRFISFHIFAFFVLGQGIDSKISYSKYRFHDFTQSTDSSDILLNLAILSREPVDAWRGVVRSSEIKSVTTKFVHCIAFEI